MTEVKINNKNKTETKERISRIEKALPNITMKDGSPKPVWEETVSIEQQMKNLAVPGLSIALVNNYEISWLKSYGIKDIRTKDQVTLNTLFEGGSTAKPFTALATLMTLDEKGIDLEDNINKYLIDWKIPKGDFGEDLIVSFKQLLTHTAGINRPDSMFGTEEGKKPTLIQVLNGKSPAKNDPVKIQFKPGTDHAYSNFGYVILQKFLEDIHKKSFSKIIEQKIFKPLEMNNSYFGHTSEEVKQRAITPHDDKGTPRESGINPIALAMGGLVTTPEDLGKFAIELNKSYNMKKSLLPAKFSKKMCVVDFDLDPKKWFGFTGQGLGLYLIKSNNETYFAHPGTNMPGATCFFMGNLTAGNGLISMANGINGELLNIQLLFTIIREYNWSLWQ